MTADEAEYFKLLAAVGLCVARGDFYLMVLTRCLEDAVACKCLG